MERRGFFGSLLGGLGALVLGPKLVKIKIDGVEKWVPIFVTHDPKRPTRVYEWVYSNEPVRYGDMLVRVKESSPLVRPVDSGSLGAVEGFATRDVPAGSTFYMQTYGPLVGKGDSGSTLNKDGG